MTTAKITVLGGDDRSLFLAQMLQEDGNDVTIFGFEKHEASKKLNEATGLKEALAASTIIIGPLPFTDQENRLHAPYHAGEVNMTDVFKHINKNHILLGGYISDEHLQAAAKGHVKIIDYFKREELQVLNAIPTAEGATQLAMEKMNRTLHGSKVMILGFGRIGKILAKILSALGAKVIVAARKHEAVAWIDAYNYDGIFIEQMESELYKMDVIFNTVPAITLTETNLRRVNKSTLIIDLASEPGGIDLSYAEERGMNVVKALGLPGKVAPLSAANCIRETIYNVLYDLEVYK